MPSIAEPPASARKPFRTKQLRHVNEAAEGINRQLPGSKNVAVSSASRTGDAADFAESGGLNLRQLFRARWVETARPVSVYRVADGRSADL